MSRIGRNYLEIGFYTEVLFRKKNVRFIAISNNVDSALNDGSNEFAPFLNIMNDSLIMSALALVISLTGCGNTNKLSEYDMTGISFIEYTDIDTVCEDKELITAGSNLLSDQEDNLLLSYVVDSAIELSAELGDYDHLVFTNPKWIENFGDSGKLKPIEYSSLSKSMQEFLDSQMPILTNDGSVLPEGTGLYEYEGGGLLAFPVNVTLGSAKPIEAKNPLVMLIDNPAEILKADSCLLPLTSSGNVLFLDSDNLQQAFENSELKDYGDIQKFNEK